MIQWNDDWNTGIDIVDSEHKTLVEILRRIEKEDSEYLRASLLSLSSEVTNHITSHFMHEEQLSADIVDAHAFQAHQRDHQLWKQLLLRENAKLQMELASRPSHDELYTLAHTYAEAIANFFVQHWANHDCRLCNRDCQPTMTNSSLLRNSS